MAVEAHSEQIEEHRTTVFPDRLDDPESTWSWECSCLDEATEFEDEDAANTDADDHRSIRSEE